MNYNVGNPYMTLSFADYMSGNERNNSVQEPVYSRENTSQVKYRNIRATTWIKKLISSGKKLIEMNAGNKTNCIECEVCK